MDYRMTPEETRIFLGTDWRAFALLHERLEQELRAAGERDAYILTADGVVAWAIDPEFCFRAPRAAEET